MAAQAEAGRGTSSDVLPLAGHPHTPQPSGRGQMPDFVRCSVRTRDRTWIAHIVDMPETALARYRPGTAHISSLLCPACRIRYNVAGRPTTANVPLCLCASEGSSHLVVRWHIFARALICAWPQLLFSLRCKVGHACELLVPGLNFTECERAHAVQRKVFHIERCEYASVHHCFTQSF